MVSVQRRHHARNPPRATPPTLAVATPPDEDTAYREMLARAHAISRRQLDGNWDPDYVSTQLPLPFPPPPCDPAKPNAQSPTPHDYRYLTDEYDSLGNGGSYEVYRCARCGRRAYTPLPD